MPTDDFVLVEQAKTAQPMSNLDIRTRNYGKGDAWSMYHGSLAQRGSEPPIATHTFSKKRWQRPSL